MSSIQKPLSEWLRDSIRSGLLFGRHDEPLDDYGKRIVRVILAEVDRTRRETGVVSATAPERIGCGRCGDRACFGGCEIGADD
jgi:hypothetical protein